MNNGNGSNPEDLFGEDFKNDRWETAYRLVTKRFGKGQESRFDPQFELRLRIIRLMLELDPQIWSDKVFARLTRGHEGENATSRFNRIKKKGDLKVDANMAAMFAGVVSYILAVEPVWSSRPTDRQLAEIIVWLETDGEAAIGDFLAADLNQDILAMTQHLSHLLDVNQYGADRNAARARTHQEILDQLTAPYDVATRRRLGIQPSGRRESTTTRFGSEMEAFGAPRDWLPLEFRPGDRIEYGLPGKSPAPSKGWLATIRDSAAAGAGYVWEHDWDQVIRWFPGGSFAMPSGLEMRVPTTYANVVTDIPGQFHVFLFIEPAASTYLAKVLRPINGVPSIDGYLALSRDIEALQEMQVSVYASSYLVLPPNA